MQKFFRNNKSRNNRVSYRKSDCIGRILGTGLELVFPEGWGEKTVINNDLGPIDNPTSNTLFICEKTNAEANAGGILFSLSFLKHEDFIYEIFPTDTVLGLYKQGNKEYVLILQLPREMNYVEGNEAMKKAYETLSSSVDEVQIRLDHIAGFTKCGVDEIDWVKYK